MFTHSLTFTFGLIIGTFFLADSKLTNLAWINKVTGLNQLSLNTQALVFAAVAIMVGLTIRALARKKGAHKR